jgi:methyl-accepting chemotaxis protein
MPEEITNCHQRMARLEVECYAMAARTDTRIGVLEERSVNMAGNTQQLGERMNDLRDEIKEVTAALFKMSRGMSEDAIRINDAVTQVQKMLSDHIVTESSDRLKIFIALATIIVTAVTSYFFPLR